jgi:hypothetical protein
MSSKASPSAELRAKLKVETPPDDRAIHERRRVPRLSFGGVVEISTGRSNPYIIAPIGNLSRFGCFVRTTESVRVGTNVSLKITYEGKEFNTPAVVIYLLAEKGLGIRFAATKPKDEALLDAWLKKAGA